MSRTQHELHHRQSKAQAGWRWCVGCRFGWRRRKGEL